MAAFLSSNGVPRILVLAAWLVLLSAGLRVDAQCGFSVSCSSESLSGTTLSATCLDNNSNQVPSSIDLNGNIGNNDGQLVCPGSDFSATCSGIALSSDQYTLIATCTTNILISVSTSINLNDCVGLNNGNLQSCV